MGKGKRVLMSLAGMLICGLSALQAQVLVESVAAIVGNEVVYLSDIENLVIDMKRNGSKLPVDQLRCMMLNELLVSRLFLDQARIDSITVSEDAVEGEVTMNINGAIQSAGSEKALEEYFDKSMVEIRRDIRKALLEQEIIREVQSGIAKNITVTPNQVKKYYSGIPKDSLPVVPARVQLSIIQLDPPGNEENKAEARQRLLDIRSEILAGKSFNVLAVMYSEDPGTARNGGELGYTVRGSLEKEYADAAFSLTKNTVSRIVETRYGFHIIQLIDRKGDLINTRHILIKPKVKPEQTIKATSTLDSLANQIPKDSLPVVPARVQLSIIQLDPPGNEENKAEARQRLLDIRSEILAGKSFNVLAVMYSEDPGTARNGGELGYTVRGSLEKEYADAAFSLTKNTVSRIVETRYGFHIIQLIDRKGDLINTRHILIKPKVKPEQTIKATSTLDSLANQIRKDSISFENAAKMYSSHKDSRINGGKLVSTNPSERITWFTLEELNPEMYVKVRDMKQGEISEAFRTTDDDGNTVFRIVRLDNEIPAHRANLKDDYESLYASALQEARSKTYQTWINKKIGNTYIKISDELKTCDFLKKGWLK
ncbi:MAG: hypothetical protein A2V64_12345 [Bacteroidetes bacterium RBG_13_43_22]|nr:MAG: hypothetical protein A2V64_12345 [Bacteroidetes bacterium RBG_13_43_22]